MKLKPIFLGLAALTISATASASLVFDDSVLLSAQGFGNAPRDLTLQAKGNASTESGCVGIDSTGNLTFGNAACTPEGSVFDANNVVNIGGDETPPLADNQKFGAPSVGSLGITSADQIGILFNGTEPAGNGGNVLDVTLSFYSPTGTLLGAIDGSQDFLNTVQGNGSAGFVFVVSSDEQAFVNGLLSAANLMTVNATIGNVSGGPESFAIVNLQTAPPCTANCGPQQVPEPGSLALIGAALIGLVGWRRKFVRA